MRILKEYKSFRCCGCKKTFIVLKTEIDRTKCLKCPHCSSWRLSVLRAADGVRECFGKEHSYKRINGVMRQVR